MSDDRKAQEERARRLRQQIKGLEKKPSAAESPEAESKPEPPGKESPREFIHRRMQELDERDDAK